MHSPSSSANEYRVEITAEAWIQLGILPARLFQRIQNELKAIAEVVYFEDALLSGPSSFASDLALTLDSVQVHYRIEASKRLVRLVAVARAPDAGLEGAP